MRHTANWIEEGDKSRQDSRRGGRGEEREKMGEEYRGE